MKVNFYTQIPQTHNFNGIREDRNTVSQLKENNNYSLTEPNQRRINQAIDNLAKQRGEENIKFLLDVGENLKYQGHVPDKKIKTKNDWETKLRTATEESLAHSNPILKEKYQPQIDKVFAPKPLSNDEEYMVKVKDRLVKKVKGDKEEDNIKKNLEYFIASTETPIEQKKYVMKKLDYFMSPKYKINPQLEDKKPQILSEIANDIALNTQDKDIPNIKAINQKTHGMCAAISIVRKAVAYEDKPNYVDAILSELDASDKVKIYDRQHIGSGKRVEVKKAYIDFNYAQERGYRIIDASTLQWMNIAGMYGSQNENLYNFQAFDKNNFDAFHDSFFAKSMADTKLMTKQSYFQALTKAKSDIKDLKSQEIKSDIVKTKNRQDKDLNLKTIQRYNDEIKIKIDNIIPNAIKQSKDMVYKELLQLSQPISSDIKKLPKELQKYAFLPNEENSQKSKKISNYFTENYGNLADKNKLEMDAENIAFILEDRKNIISRLNGNQGLPKQISDARKLYEAEAIYRASTVIGLMDDENLTDNLIKNNIPDRETLISNGFSEVTERIAKKNDKKLLAHFANIFGTTSDDKEGVLNGLTQVKASIDYLMSAGLDNLYSRTGFGDRREILINDIDDLENSVKTGDKSELERASLCLKTKPDAKVVLEKLDEMKSGLIDRPDDEKAYIEAFNKMGYKNQIDSYITIYNILQNTVFDSENPSSDIYLANFKEANGLPENASKDDVIKTLQSVADDFNSLSETMARAAEMLEIENEDGTTYFTVNPANILLKKFENEGDLIPRQTMEKLQERFAKIDKIRSSDEFSSRQGKISDPSLYKMTDEEKQAIKKIHKKLNKMYSNVSRELDYQYKEIKEPLREMARYIGTNSGSYWVPKDGQSGLFSAQEVKIFEQMTDRPHYAVEDIDVAVEQIKNGTHSGVSSSSVFHDRMGGHAQYIADVVKDEKTGKDILFHDNSWGASEHENIWVDSNGLTRTDYSDRRGGELGYITNKDWRNGNFVENLTHKKGHIAPDSTDSKLYRKLNPGYDNEFDFALMSDVILEGKSPEYTHHAAAIKDEIFLPDTIYIKNLEKYAKEMTKQELQKSFFRNETAGRAYVTKFDNIIKRITPTEFNKGITSKADYEALDDNDPVKLAFEKAAIRGSFEDADMYKELGKATTMAEVEKVRNKQYKKALKDFDYAFCKNDSTDNTFLYAAYEHGEDFSKALTSALKNHNIKADVKTLGKVIHNMALLEGDEKEKFNGSVRNSIDMFIERAEKQFDENIPQSEDSRLAKEEFLSNLRGVYDKHVYFSADDLKSDTDKAKGIRAWIDDTFQPKTNEEFISIYRMLQDMPTDEFHKYTQNIDKKYLGYKNITGYDLLVKVLNANDSAESLLRNTLFYDEYSKDITSSNTAPRYKNRKLERNLRGATYVGARTFDDLYRTMNYSLSTLEYEKMFNEYANKYYKQYGVLPAYPKVDLTKDSGIQTAVDRCKKTLEDSFNTVDVQKTCIYDIKLGHQLDDYRKSIPDNRVLTPIERKVLNTMIGDFISANATDSDMDYVLDLAYKTLELSNDSSIKDYNNTIDTIIDTVNLIESVNSIKDFEESIDSYTTGMKGFFNNILKSNIPQKYQRNVKEAITTWVDTEIAFRKQSNPAYINKMTLDLQDKISSHLINDDKKSQTEGFYEIIDAVKKAKAEYKGDLKDKENLNSQLRYLHELSDKYLDKFVDNESKPSLSANFDDWFRKELIGGKTQKVTEEHLDIAFNNFQRDFLKYHYIAHPKESLNNYLLSIAKDSDKKDSGEAIKYYLETGLNLAKYISIQDTLMDAVRTGNAAHVQDYFNEYSVYANGETVDMGSDSAIDYMVRNMLLDRQNPETAKMFVEKLGLSEKVLKIERETIKEFNPKGKIDEIAGLLVKCQDFVTTTDNECAKFLKVVDDVQTQEELEKLIIKTKRDIAKSAKPFKDRNSVKKLYDALDKSMDTIAKKPDITKSIIFSNSLQEAFSDINNGYNDKIKDVQAYVNAINLIYSFLKNIQLPEGSKAQPLQDKIAQEHEEFAKYNSDVLEAIAAKNPNIKTIKTEY